MFLIKLEKLRSVEVENSIRLEILTVLPQLVTPSMLNISTEQKEN